MPAFNIEVSIDIAASTQVVHDALADFSTWPEWSPWLYMERDAKVTLRGSAGQPGHAYDWSGTKIGAGKMTLDRITPNRLDYHLQFLKPFKSDAEVAFDIESISSSLTRVTWHMQSSLPFFVFWMKARVAGMIRSDFQRGLLLLKDYLETGMINSSTKLAGQVDVDATNFVGIRRKVAMSEIASSLGADFDTLQQAAKSGSFFVSGAPICIYNQVDSRNQQFHYTAALPIDEQARIGDPLFVGAVADCKALKVVHVGPYWHLGNAWAWLMAEARLHKLKPSKKQPMFERYLNDPGEIDAAELITELYFPVRK